MRSTARSPHAPRGLALAAVLLGGALALPAAAPAASIPFGSDLVAPAELENAQQADVVYYQAALATGGQTTVPADGQINAVQIKGMAPRRPNPQNKPVAEGAGSPLFHIQILRPQADGTHKVIVTSSDFDMPTTGDPQQVTTFVSSYRLCAKAGDVVAFNNIGGWDGVTDQTGPYPMGTPMRIFAGLPGSTTPFYVANEGTKDGATIRASGGDDQELLMRSTLGTGPDANQVCPGGTGGSVAPTTPGASGGTAPAITGATITSKKVSLSRKGTALVALKCNRKATAGCVGTLRMTAKLGAKTVTIAQKRYSLRVNQGAKPTLKLSKAGTTLFVKARRKLKIGLVAETRQASGTPFTNAKAFVLKPFKK